MDVANREGDPHADSYRDPDPHRDAHSHTDAYPPADSYRNRDADPDGDSHPNADSAHRNSDCYPYSYHRAIRLADSGPS